MDFRSFIEKLKKQGKIVDGGKLSLDLELAKFIDKNEPNPVISEVRESGFKIVSNVYATKEMVSDFLNINVSDLTWKMLYAIENRSKPESVAKDKAPVMQNEITEVDLEKMPIPLHLKEDGGRYFTSAVVFAKDPEFGQNSSYHRMMVIGKDKVVARILPRNLNTFIENADKRGEELDIAFAVGLPASVALASSTSVEAGVDELEIANSLSPFNTVTLENGIEVPADAEFVYVGKVTKEEIDEGPFLDLTGTYDIVRKQRVIKIEKIYHRDNALHHVLLPGGAEHKILMGLPREPTMFREVKKIVDCVNVNLTKGGCSWLHGVVSIRKKNEDDGIKAIEAAFNGHKSMKHVVIVDEDIDVNNPEEVEWALATRVQTDKNFYVFPDQKGSSLDPSADSITRKTAKAGIDATMPLKDKEKFKKIEY